MLLGPLFLLNSFLISVFALSPLRTYSWMLEMNRVTFAQERVETSLRYCSYENHIVSDETLNAWLAHRLPPNDHSICMLGDPPRMDSWGNPYRIKAREISNSEAMVYSTGRDGHSESDGNDPDDIRSWDENRAKWYQASMYRRELGGCMVLSAIVTPLLFLGLIKLIPIARPSSDVSEG